MLMTARRGRSTGGHKATDRQQSHKDALHRFLATSAESSTEINGLLKGKPVLGSSSRPNGPSTAGRHDVKGDEESAERTPRVKHSEAVAAVQPQITANTTSVQHDTSRQDQLLHSGSNSLGTSTLIDPTQTPVETDLPTVEPQPSLHTRKQGEENGAKARPNVHQAQGGNREYQHGRVDSKSAIIQTSPGGTSHEVVDIDQANEAIKPLDQHPLSTQASPGDMGKLADGLSSPSSTAQTATTPAIHDASTDTSPDNAGPQYGDRDDAKSEPVDTPPAQDDTPSPAVAPNSQAVTAATSTYSTAGLGLQPKHSVEAQLLQETEAAHAAEDGLLRSTTVAADDGLPAVDQQQVSRLPNRPPSPAQSDNVGLTSHDSHLTSTKPPNGRHSSTSQCDGIDEGIPGGQGTTPLSSARASIAEPNPAPPGPTSTCMSVPEKAVTRMSSGAIRQKSVSELLGSRRKSIISPQSLPAPGEHNREPGAPGASTTSGIQALIAKSKTKGKPKATTVVFGPQQRRGADNVEPAKPSASGQLFAKDYFTPLFIQNFAQNSKSIKPMDQLVNQAHKTVSGADLQAVALDNQACRVLKRVYALQQQDKWSLRQPIRCPEPPRQPSHLDVLLQEMMWMRTDFREERKWKAAIARNLARSCAEWVFSTPEQREALQVTAVIPGADENGSADAAVTNGVVVDDGEGASPTPDLVPSNDSDSVPDSDELLDGFNDAKAPSAIFAMTNKDLVFGLQSSPASEQLLGHLPTYGTPLKVPRSDLPGLEGDPDSRWRRPALPLSKYVEGRLQLKESRPPAKRSRFQYCEEDEDHDAEDASLMPDAEPNISPTIERENRDIALFKPEMKAVRDRLHAGHQFRPPTEHPMPSQSFYESRPASQWTYAEDDQLKALVREHSYNWSLIASIVSSRSIFSSGPERRTPWECFERWVHLEGLPNDMAKTQYFKTYQHRIEAAQRAIQEQNQRVTHVGPNGPLTPGQRRRPSTSVRVERRRNQKHLAMIDAMRKLAKKREAALQKSQYNANMAASRKANEPAQRPQQATKTPREYSLMRWERDQQLAEKMAQLAQRQSEAHRRV